MQQEKNPVSYPHLSCIGLYRDYMGVTCNFTKNKPVPTKSLSCKTENKGKGIKLYKNAGFHKCNWSFKPQLHCLMQ